MFERATSPVRRRLKKLALQLAGDESLERRIAEERPTANEYGLDPFGFDLDWALSGSAPLLWLYRHYFRCRTYGLENLPRGRVLLVSNHSGQLPFDAAMIGMALLSEARPPRVVRSMVERWMPTLPFVSVYFSRMGQVVGTPENARRLLQNEEALLVFPEGVRGLNKLWNKRYELADFGHGFMRLALENRAPIVPVAVIGAEEQAPAVANLAPVAKLLGMPALPVTPLGLPLPLPARYHLHFGEPLRFEGSPDDDEAEIDGKVREVRATIQAMLNRGLKQRQHVFL